MFLRHPVLLVISAFKLNTITVISKRHKSVDAYVIALMKGCIPIIVHILSLSGITSPLAYNMIYVICYKILLYQKAI